MSSQILPLTKMSTVPLVVILRLVKLCIWFLTLKACGSAYGSGESYEGASCVARGNAVSLPVGQQGGT